MSFSSQELESYVPVYDVIPNNWEEARPFLVEQLRKISNAINVREIGFFLDEELLSGKQFFPGSVNSQQFRSVLRKVIDFGALPNATTKSISHDIDIDDTFSLIDLFASATRPPDIIVPVLFSAITIPFSSPILNENIKITIDDTNVNITTAIDYSSYTRCFIVIEYIQEL